MIKKEVSLISEAIRNYPDEFASKNNIDNYAKMRHFGLTTRLLDWTSNPFVALFFACQNTKVENNNGVVYKDNMVNVYSENTEVVKMIIDYVFVYKVERGKFDKETLEKKYSLLDTNKIQNNEFEELKKNNYIYIKTKLNNSRIRNQSGYFSIAMPEINGQYDVKNVCFSNKKFDNNKAIIPYNSKSKILKELCIVGINSGYIYNDIQNGCKYINEMVENSNLASYMRSKE